VLDVGAAIVLQDVTVEFTARSKRFLVFEPVSFDVPAGGSLAIVGSSGAGKSTLLNTVSGLVQPSAGSVFVGGERIDQKSRAALCDFRRANIGFVFQAFHLLPHLSALENVIVGAQVHGLSKKEAVAVARAAIGEVGLTHRQDHRPAELSGGEQQRIALARVLASNPAVVLADEPTGNLDPSSAASVIQMLTRLRDLIGATILVATHSAAVAAFAEARFEVGARDRAET
jgi:ABC-type lipoprotein export system ATPase subunit